MDGDIANELSQRVSGPLHLRFILQPVLAMVFAAKDGIRDAHRQAAPFLPALMFKPGERRARIAQAWASVGTVFCLAFLLDCLFQYVTAGRFELIEALGMAILLCAIPYTLVRGPVNRIARRKH
ncbi:MAG: hypothetical protein AB3N11_09115 [Arenibacterium sp.]